MLLSHPSIAPSSPTNQRNPLRDSLRSSLIAHHSVVSGDSADSRGGDESGGKGNGKKKRDPKSPNRGQKSESIALSSRAKKLPPFYHVPNGKHFTNNIMESIQEVLGEIDESNKVRKRKKAQTERKGKERKRIHNMTIFALTTPSPSHLTAHQRPGCPAYPLQRHHPHLLFLQDHPFLPHFSLPQVQETLQGRGC